MGLSLFFMFLSAAICLLLPVALAVVLAVKRRGSFLMFILGVASFTASQLLLRMPLLGELQNTVWFNMFALTQPLLCGVLTAFSAGIFEETGRFAALKLINKDLLTWENGVMFGLGHGGVEAFSLTGLYYVKLISDAVSGSNTLTAAGVPPYYFVMGGVERILAIALHIGFTMLVMYGVKRRKAWLFLLAILAHGLVDITIPLFRGLSGWAMEGIFAVLAISAAILTIKIRPALNRVGRAGEGGIKI
jgi:uncharacterized membrane protein YhfC